MSGIGVGVVTALAAAVCFAVANTLQHHGASQAPHGRAFHPGLVAHLFTRPVWLVGIAADLVGMCLHALALSTAALAVIQPLLVSGLLFALPVSRLVTGRRIRGTEYGWAVLVVTGLSVFLLAAHLTGGQAAAAGPLLGVGVTGAAGLAAAAATVAQRRGCRHRAALLGVATGVTFGVVAALIKQITTLALLGLPAVLTSWPLYVLALAGAAGMLLSQAAYQAGPLTGSLPAITIADPVIGIAIGVLAFGETLAAGPLMLIAALAGFVVMTVGVVALAHRSAAPTADPGEAAPTEPVDQPHPGCAALPERAPSAHTHRVRGRPHRVRPATTGGTTRPRAPAATLPGRTPAPTASR